MILDYSCCFFYVQSFHSRCLRCFDCGKGLDSGSLKSRESAIYCQGKILCFSLKWTVLLRINSFPLKISMYKYISVKSSVCLYGIYIIYYFIIIL
jgi:hypothetical protein